jgi:hypothetical protein
MTSWDAERVKREVTETQFAEILELHGARVNRRGRRASCAAHGGDNPNALSYRERDGTVLWNCFTREHGGTVLDLLMECRNLTLPEAVEWVAGRLGEQQVNETEPSVKLTTRYSIRDPEGALVAVHIRRNLSDGRKKFGWERNGKPGLGGFAPADLPLYGSHLLKQWKPQMPVFVTEGEKAADALREHGFQALGTVTGQGVTPGLASLSLLNGINSILWPDNDGVGRAHMERIAGRIVGAAAGVRMLKWGQHEGDDAADFFARGGTPQQLRDLARGTPAWSPADGPGPVTVPLASVEPETVSWLWPRWIARGKLHVLDGDPGVGKSTLTIAFAAALSLAAPFPDGCIPGAAGVSVLSTAEDGLADTVRPRLDAAGGDPSRVFAFTLEVPLDAFPSGLESLEREILLRDADLVVIDPIMAHLDSSVNSHRDQDVRAVLRELAAIAGRTNAAIVLVRHLNKAAGGPAIYRGGGSIGIGGAARVVMLAAADPDEEGRFVLAPVKNNLAPLPSAIAYRIAGDSNANAAGRIEWLGTSDLSAGVLLAAQAATKEDRSAVDEAEEWLRDYLSEGRKEARDVKNDARKAGIKGITLQRASRRLKVLKQKEGFREGWFWGLPSSEDDQTVSKVIIPGEGSSSASDDHLRDGEGPSEEAQWVR